MRQEIGAIGEVDGTVRVIVNQFLESGCYICFAVGFNVVGGYNVESGGFAAIFLACDGRLKVSAAVSRKK